MSDDEIESSVEKWKEFNTGYTIQKAGMMDVDREEIQKAIYELSKVIWTFKSQLQ